MLYAFSASTTRRTTMSITTGEHADRAKQIFSIPEIIFFLVIVLEIVWLVISEAVVWLGK
jgi:hypothetical protein